MLTKTKDEVANDLARKHYEIEEGVIQIVRIRGSAEAEADPAEPIKLLEVNENTVPAGVMPLHFGPVPASGIDYPSVIVEVTPDEFRKIQAHELELPAGWKLGDVIPRPEEENGQ